MDSSRTYTVAEVSAILGIAQSTIYEMVRESRAGHLYPIRVGRAVRFPKNVIDNLAAPEVA